MTATKGPLVRGAQWKSSLGGQCLPQAAKKLRFVIPNNKLEEYINYMKDHALNCKFIRAWPIEKELIKRIQVRWQLKGHIDLKLGEKCFFTVIFSNLVDKDKVF